jgi:predicted nuclease of predicted toxin-antitoxin system
LRCLADENFPAATVTALRDRGHDVAWIHTDAPGSKDQAVLERAQSEERILLTFDKDFGELAFRFGLRAASGVILFRLPTPSPEYVTRVVVSVLESRTDWSGQFAVVEGGSIRLTPLPKQR